MGNNATPDGKGQKMIDNVRSWVMVVLTFLFVGLYAASLFGWLKPLDNDKMVVRLEPIIFVIIGYYFGRLPGQENEKTLKNEVNRQTDRADKAQQGKEQSEKTSESLQEKVKNAKAALTSAMPGAPSSGFATTLSKGTGAIPADSLHHAVAAALNVLDS